MRRPIEKLARQLADDPKGTELLELSHKYMESIERIMDALAVLKILREKSMLEEPPITYVGL